MVAAQRAREKGSKGLSYEVEQQAESKHVSSGCPAAFPVPERGVAVESHQRFDCLSMLGYNLLWDLTTLMFFFSSVHAMLIERDPLTGKKCDQQHPK